jgi:signal peptidase II
MENTLREKLIRLLIVSIIIIIADQLTKYIILTTMPLHSSIPVIQGFFNITHVHNPGGAFGMFADGSPLLRKLLFLVVSSLAICFVLYFYHSTPLTHRVLSFGFAMIFGGAVGNMIDRVRFGKVVDFLDVYIRSYHWPAFNVADSAITIGVTIFVIHLLFDKMPES